MIGRREFITLLGGAASWPLTAPAQQGQRMRRIGVLIGSAADDPQAPARIAALAQGLQELGWTADRNLRIDYRFGGGNVDELRRHAAGLTTLAPDVVMANGSAAVTAVQGAARHMPIVFTSVIDPVGAGFVETLAHPGGNITGFLLYEYSMSGKWLELLKEIAPSVRRVAVLRDADIAAGAGQFGVIQSLAPQLGVELRAIGVRQAGEIERGLASFSAGSNGGMIVTGSGLALVHRDLIIQLAARHRLPAVYPQQPSVISGGLVSYAPNYVDPFRRAAAYIDRILKGEKPADLPVQAPTKYELVINLKTAKALGLDVPASLLARADEVIE
jgi:putative tryptophan/tyrosine transport system substrate-binding protein